MFKNYEKKYVKAKPDDDNDDDPGEPDEATEATEATTGNLQLCIMFIGYL